jgi:preprotein translocase SecE subunit
VQTAQLPDDEVEAKYAGPLRVEQVLPLVRQAHAAPGDALAVARNTRQQRRRRRDQQQQQQQQQKQQETGAKEQGLSQRARTRQAQVRPAQQPPKTQTGRRGGGGGGRRFVGESVAELKKVEWPGQRQVMTGSVVVLIACGIVGFYLWLADLAIEPLVERVLLGR